MIGFEALSGWLAAAVVLGAASVPTLHRLTAGKRATLVSRTIRSHVVVGITASALAFVHTLAILPALGSPAAIGGGTIALASGAVAFLLLVAHVGVGLKLRNPKLKERASTRRTHVFLASLIGAAVIAHAVLILRG